MNTLNTKLIDRLYWSPWPYSLIVLMLLFSQATFASSVISASSPAQLKILTYNVLSHENAEDRFAGFITQMLTEKPDLIALQEASGHFLDYLAHAPALNDYRIVANRAPGGRVSGGLAYLTRLPVLWQRYQRLPSSMGRGVLQLDVNVPACSQALSLANVHLDSSMQDTAWRIQQMKKVTTMLEGITPAIWLGDFNFGDADDEQARIPDAFVDLWSQLQADNPGLTYNRDENPLADKHGFWFEPSRRLDRVFLKDDNHQFIPQRIKLVGNKSLPTGGLVSDHYGVLVTLRCMVNTINYRGRSRH